MGFSSPRWKVWGRFQARHTLIIHFSAKLKERNSTARVWLAAFGVIGIVGYLSFPRAHLTWSSVYILNVFLVDVSLPAGVDITHRLVRPVVLLEDVLSSILTAVRKQHDYFITVRSGNVRLLPKKKKKGIILSYISTACHLMCSLCVCVCVF